MRRHRILMIVLATVVLVVGLLLIPRRDEHLTMLARDGRFEDALRIVAQMRAQGDDRPELLAQQVLLQMKLGDVPRALEASRAYLQARPGDNAALEIHADLLLHMGHLDEHLAVEERLVRARPEPLRAARLLAKLRLSGRFEQELALLRHLAGTRALRFESYERLGALLAAAGDRAGAAHWLGHVDRLAPSEESRARLRLLHVLLQMGRGDEAAARAQRWLSSWRDAYLAGQVILALARHGGESAVLPVVRNLADTMPAAVLEVAGVLTEAGQTGVSRHLLAQWIDRTPLPTPAQARDWVHASLAAGEARRPLLKLLQMLHDSADPESVAGMAEEIAHAYGPDSLAHLMPALAADILPRRPLLAADLAQATGNLALAQWYLDKVDIARMSERQQDRWLELAGRIGPPSRMLERLLVLWQQRALPPRLTMAMAHAARAAGRPAVHDAILAALRR
jgi:tetratricopeptide (TPR) repeat protein